MCARARRVGNDISTDPIDLVPICPCSNEFIGIETAKRGWITASIRDARTIPKC